MMTQVWGSFAHKTLQTWQNCSHKITSQHRTLARYEKPPDFVPTYQHHTASAGTFQSGDQQIHADTLIDHTVPKSELQELGEPSQ